MDSDPFSGPSVGGYSFDACQGPPTKSIGLQSKEYYLTSGTNVVHGDPFLGVSVKVNLDSEIDRCGLIVRVGGS